VTSRYAPIVFFGYNRAKHAVMALDSLKACPEIDATPVYIYMDGAKNEEGVAAVEAARDAVRAAAPAHARIVYREQNMGLANSIRAGVTAACAEYGRVIVIEDDLVLSPAALTYFNRALDRYQDDERVMHIAGCWPEPDPRLPPSFFLRWPAVWGWATWDRAWSKLEWDLEKLRDEIGARDLVGRFTEGGWDFYAQLLGTLEGKYDSWGIRWYATVLLEGGLALHPRETLVANTGTDGSGVHGDRSTAYSMKLGHSVPDFPPDVVESGEAVRAWGAFNRRLWYRPLWRRVAGRLVRIARRVVGGVRARLGG